MWNASIRLCAPPCSRTAVRCQTDGTTGGHAGVSPLPNARLFLSFQPSVQPDDYALTARSYEVADTSAKNRSVNVKNSLIGEAITPKFGC